MSLSPSSSQIPALIADERGMLLAHELDVEALGALLKRIAIHEAGHAVARVVMGLRFDHVEIAPRRAPLRFADGHTGETLRLGAVELDEEGRAVWLRQLNQQPGEDFGVAYARWINSDARAQVGKAAGPTAEAKHVGDDEDELVRAGSVADFAMMTHETMRRAWSMGKRFVAAAWPAIVAVADALLARAPKRLSFGEVVEIARPYLGQSLARLTHIGRATASQRPFLARLMLEEDAPGADSYLLFVDKPTPLLTLLESALNFAGRNLVWAGGQIRVVSLGEGSQISTLVNLNEGNKAKRLEPGDRTPVLERTTCDRNPDGIINRATIKYNRDLTGTFQKTLTVNAVSSQSDNAGQVKSISVDAYGIYENFDLAPGGSTLTWESNVAAPILAYFGQNLAVAERTYDFSVATRMYPGARVSLTDSYLVNPATGTRGVSGLLCWVLSTSFDWSTGVGRCRLVFQPSRPTSIDVGGTTHLAAWGPSAIVDSSFGAGANVPSGLGADANTVVLYKFNEQSVC